MPRDTSCVEILRPLGIYIALGLGNDRVAEANNVYTCYQRHLSECDLIFSSYKPTFRPKHAWIRGLVIECTYSTSSGILELLCHIT